MTYRDKYIEEFGKEPDLYNQCPYENSTCDECPIYNDSFTPCWLEEIALAITALKLISTVDEAKELGGSYTSSYWQGWNDALEAIKVRLQNGEDWSDMNEASN